jgi:hypothetical protein
MIWKCPLPYNVSSTVPRPGHIRVEFPDLIRYRDHWYCGFRQAPIHENHPDAEAWIIRSADGERWEQVKVIRWDGADAGTPRFSITAEGLLMVNAQLNFVSREPREDGFHYQLDRATLGLGFTPHSEREPDVASQSATWLSDDGVTWTAAHACAQLLNTNLFHVTWHNGMGYGVANELGKNRGGTLYRTRDGRSWRVLAEKFVPADQADEAALAFTGRDQLVCLLRGSRQTPALLGTSDGPYYQKWTWREPTVDWSGDGRHRPIGEVFRVGLGGPKLVRLSDGRILGAGRTLPPERPDGPWRVDPGDPLGREDGRAVLFWVDPVNATFRQFAEFDGTSYPGVAEHDGRIWVTTIDADRAGIFLASAPMAGRESRQA